VPRFEAYVHKPCDSHFDSAIRMNALGGEHPICVQTSAMCSGAHLQRGAFVQREGPKIRARRDWVAFRATSGAHSACTCRKRRSRALGRTCRPLRACGCQPPRVTRASATAKLPLLCPRRRPHGQQPLHQNLLVLFSPVWAALSRGVPRLPRRERLRAASATLFALHSSATRARPACAHTAISEHVCVSARAFFS
jgi:hypothetical protein